MFVCTLNWLTENSFINKDGENSFINKDGYI